MFTAYPHICPFLDKEVKECVRNGKQYNGNIARSVSGRHCYQWETLLSQNEENIANGVQPLYHPMVDGLHNFPDSSFKNLGNKCRYENIHNLNNHNDNNVFFFKILQSQKVQSCHFLALSNVILAVCFFMHI